MSINPIKVVETLVQSQNNLADFIANGPDNGLGGYVRNQYRKRCDQFANLPGWAQALGNGSTGTMNRICTPWWDSGGFDGLRFGEPPFNGGQCAGIQYGVIITRANGNGSSNNLFARGPITELSVSQIDGITYRVTLSGFTSGGAPFTDSQVVNVLGGEGPPTAVLNRVDGQPDDCGDPETAIEPGLNPPPDPGPTPGPEPTTNPDDPFGPPLLPIPDYEDPIGGPTPIEAPPDDGGNISPEDIPGNTDSQEGSGDNVAEPISVDPGPGTDGDTTDFGEPPTGKVWVGALLRFNIPTDYGIIPGSAPANPVAQRVVGNASLVFENGRGTAFRVRSGSIDIFRPTGALKVTGVYVNCLPGITYTVSPVSLEKCPENSCTQE